MWISCKLILGITVLKKIFWPPWYWEFLTAHLSFLSFSFLPPPLLSLCSPTFKLLLISYAAHFDPTGRIIQVPLSEPNQLTKVFFFKGDSSSPMVNFRANFQLKHFCNRSERNNGYMKCEGKLNFLLRDNAN